MVADVVHPDLVMSQLQSGYSNEDFMDTGEALTLHRTGIAHCCHWNYLYYSFVVDSCFGRSLNCHKVICDAVNFSLDFYATPIK